MPDDTSLDNKAQTLVGTELLPAHITYSNPKVPSEDGLFIPEELPETLLKAWQAEQARQLLASLALPKNAFTLMESQLQRLWDDWEDYQNNVWKIDQPYEAPDIHKEPWITYGVPYSTNMMPRWSGLPPCVSVDWGFGDETVTHTHSRKALNQIRKIYGLPPYTDHVPRTPRQILKRRKKR